VTDFLYDAATKKSTTLKTDPKYLKNYIDNNLKTIDYWHVPLSFGKQDKKYRYFFVTYNSNKKLKFSIDQFSLNYKDSKQGIKLRGLKGRYRLIKVHIGAKVKYVKKNGFIYPPYFDSRYLPVLTRYATAIHEVQRRREQFLLHATIATQFSLILTSYVPVPGSLRNLGRSQRGLLRLRGKAPRAGVGAKGGKRGAEASRKALGSKSSNGGRRGGGSSGVGGHSGGGAGRRPPDPKLMTAAEIAQFHKLLRTNPALKIIRQTSQNILRVIRNKKITPVERLGVVKILVRNMQSRLEKLLRMKVEVLTPSQYRAKFGRLDKSLTGKYTYTPRSTPDATLRHGTSGAGLRKIYISTDAYKNVVLRFLELAHEFSARVIIRHFAGTRNLYRMSDAALKGTIKRIKTAKHGELWTTHYADRYTRAKRAFDELLRASLSAKK
jgi:hypothetical protein